MAGEILAGGLSIGFTAYGELLMVNCAPLSSLFGVHSYLTSPSWRKFRKAGHEGLNIRAAEKYQESQEVEAAMMAVALMEDPDHWDDHLRR
jgi:hypothetical protein